MNALGPAVRGGARCSASCVESATTDERLPGRDLVRADARRVVLESAGQLERAETKEEQHMSVGKATVLKKK